MLHDKILLINPSYSGSPFHEPQLHSGLGYLAQSIQDNGLDHDVFDMSIGYNDKDLMSKIEEYKPSLIGMTMATYRYKENYIRLNAIKQNFPDISIAVGGPNISLMRERALTECKGIDFGVVLEGEETIIDLCRGDKEFKDIKGLIFRKDEKVIFSGERDFCAELDNFSFPKYDKFELKKYPRINAKPALREIPIVTSRGCSAQCAFCNVQTSAGRKFRYRSPESLLNEITYWYAKGYSVFRIADDNFPLIKDRALHLCRLIKESGMKGLALGCGNGIRADKVDRETLMAMKEAGFRSVWFEIAGGNNKILETLKKEETLEAAENAVKTALELKFSVSASFLIGSPGETKADIEDSFALARRYPFSQVGFYHAIPYPGTELYDLVEKYGYFITKPDLYLNEISSSMNRPVYYTPELSEEDRKEIYDEAFKLSKEMSSNNYQKEPESRGLPATISKFFAGLHRKQVDK